ncbi:MAG: hypothetical protein IPO08_22730 [Xanthomonadales bacterium]|nr:hypothetical protein [Xanthomonadales bacterium]
MFDTRPLKEIWPLYMIGQPYLDDRSWFRVDRCAPERDPFRVFIFDSEDRSELFTRETTVADLQRCACCYLGLAHSQLRHDQSFNSTTEHHYDT